MEQKVNTNSKSFNSSLVDSCYNGVAWLIVAEIVDVYELKDLNLLSFYFVSSLRVPDGVKDGENCDLYFYGSNGEESGHSVVKFYSTDTIRNSLIQAGFGVAGVRLIRPVVSESGLEKYGAEFWKDFIDPPMGWLFECTK